MTAPDPADRVADSARSVISVVNDSLTGHARHAADLVARSADPAAPIDPGEELARFSRRLLRDGALLFRSLWAMVEALAWDPASKTPFPLEVAPESNPIDTRVGPVATRGQCRPADLRRRGDPSPTIPAAQITVTRDANDPSQLELCIEAGGVPRGLYEGTILVGSGSRSRQVLYNVYVDW